MKYVVKDVNGNVLATYDNSSGSWEVSELNLERDAKSKAPTLIEAVLEEHRRKGRIVSEET